MNLHPVVRWLALATAAAVAGSVVTTVAVADERRAAVSTVKACASKKTGALRLSRPACRSTERAVSWSVRGPRGTRGPAGPPGPAGALRSTAINVGYAAIPPSNDQASLGGVSVELECGSSRIGPDSVNAVFRADEMHGTVVGTRFKDDDKLGTTLTSLDSSGILALPSLSVSPGTVTHATAYVSLVVTDHDGVVHGLDLYLTRDTRQSRPVCEFIGSITEMAPATLSP